MDRATQDFVEFMTRPIPKHLCQAGCGTEYQGTLCPECLRRIGEEVSRELGTLRNPRTGRDLKETDLTKPPGANH